MGARVRRAYGNLAAAVDCLGSAVRGLVAAVKPTFMLPAVVLAASGALLAPTADGQIAAVHAAAVGAALYTAHVVDEYVDGHVRDEDDAVLSATACLYAAVGATVAFFALVAVLWTANVRAAAVATVPLWVLAALHAPALDRHPVTVTLDFPLGVALAFVGGYLTQTGRIAPGVLAVAVVLAVSLSGQKVAIDRLDSTFDATIGKRTLPVLLGDATSVLVAAGFHVLTAVLVLAFVATSVLPKLAALAAAVSLTNAAALGVTSPQWAVRSGMALTYPFVAVLLAGQCLATDCAGLAMLAAFLP